MMTGISPTFDPPPWKDATRTSLGLPFWPRTESINLYLLQDITKYIEIKSLSIAGNHKDEMYRAIAAAELSGSPIHRDNIYIRILQECLANMAAKINDLSFLDELEANKDNAA